LDRKEHGKQLAQWRAEYPRYRRGERDFPGMMPRLPAHVLAWRRQTLAATKPNGGGLANQVTQPATFRKPAATSTTVSSDIMS
jgi:hypothetical protein